jgi:predicted phage terminase large subunit-like protein
MQPTDLLPLCRDSLIGFAIAQYPSYAPAAHHRLIAQKLQAIERGELKRLMISMPPRHGKSMLASEFFPAWYLGRGKGRQIIHATYAQELADDFGRKVRNLLKSDLYKAVFPNTRLSDDSTAAARFHTNSGGVYHAVGVGGASTGRGAHLLLIDDPIKGRAEADSETTRKQLKDWYSSVAYTRLMPGGAIVIIQTRWHEDDLAGWILREHPGEQWDILSLPAINEEKNEALWPESFPLDRLQEIKSVLAPRDWEALYQQRPRAGTGGEFKRHWLQFYDDVNPKDLSVVMLVDPAAGKKANNDYTSIWVVGLGADDNYYILDMVRDRLNLTERADTVFRLHRRWKPVEVRYERYGMMADVEYLRQEMNRRTYRFALREVGGATSKIDRIRRLVPLFETNRVWLPHELHYTGTDGKTRNLIDDFVELEYLAFPVAQHDDMLDALARIAEPSLELPWPRKKEVHLPVVSFGIYDPVVGY